MMEDFRYKYKLLVLSGTPGWGRGLLLVQQWMNCPALISYQVFKISSKWDLLELLELIVM